MAYALDMPYYVFNFADRFKTDVIDKFVHSYEMGVTPNPCIDCNRYLKFDKLFQRMVELNYDYVVTGHYAQIDFDENTGRYLLKKAVDHNKDQSYVLYNFTQEQLAHTLMPLGGYNKDWVRQKAEELGLGVAHKPDSQEICFVEDDDYGMREFEVNINDIIGEYQEILSKKDIAYIKDIIHNHESTGEYAVTPLMLRSREIAFNPTIDTQSSAPYHSMPSTGVLKAHHCVFKIPMKRGILSYTNAYGEIEQKVVNEDYVLDPTIGDIDIEYTYVLQCWEAYRFGDKDWGVYTKAQPCVVQREEVNNLNHCKLPYNGLSRLMLLNNPKPIPYRLLPYLALYRLYTLVEERTIMKFRSWLLIPESFLADTNDMTMEERLDAANRDGTLVFDDSEIAKQQPSLQAIKEIANTTMINYLTVLNQIKQSIKQEAYELANMNDQRAGDIQARAGKAVTEMGLNQALMGSVWSLKIFDSFRSRDMEANLDAAKIAWIDDFEGSYIDPNTNEVVQVRVNGTDFVNSNFGIFVGNSAELNEQVRKLEEIAFSAAQNGNFDVAAEAVCNHNVASLRKYIKEAADAQRKFELEREEIQKKWDAEIEQMRSANSEAQRKFDAEQAQLDRDSKEAIAADSNLTQIIVNDAKLQVDKDGNGYISEDESNANSLDAYLKMTKLNLDIDRASLERAKFEEQKRMNRINANKPRKP